MKALFDSNIVVAGVLRGHVHHERAAHWLNRALSGEVQGCISATTVAECYAVLTTYPDAKARPGPHQAVRMLEDLIGQGVEVVSLSATDYLEVVGSLADRNIRGRLVYDAMIARAAAQARVDRLITFNVADFVRVWPLDPAMVHAP